MVGEEEKREKSDWWCEEIKMAVRKKRECYESWLQSGGEENWTKYKSVSREVKVLIKQKKNRVAEEWGTKVAEKFIENKKAFYKEVNAVRKERCELEERIKGEDGKEILKGIECDRRWKNHFESLLNGNTRAGVNVERYEEAEEVDSAEVEWSITNKEVEEAILKLKNAKAAGLDEIAGEMLKKGGVAIVE